MAGVYFATVIAQTFPSRVLENQCFLMDSPSPSRIRRDMQHLGPSREGLCLWCRRNALFSPSNPGFCHVGRRSLDCHNFLGGGGSCRRQGKSACSIAPAASVVAARTVVPPLKIPSVLDGIFLFFFLKGVGSGGCDALIFYNNLL